jgi:hypothetical protein
MTASQATVACALTVELDLAWIGDAFQSRRDIQAAAIVPLALGDHIIAILYRCETYP